MPLPSSVGYNTPHETGFKLRIWPQIFSCQYKLPAIKLWKFSPSFLCGKLYEELIHVLKCVFQVLLYFHPSNHPPQWHRLGFRAASPVSISLNVEAHHFFLLGLAGLSESDIFGSLLGDRSGIETVETYVCLLDFSYRKQQNILPFLFHAFVLNISQYDNGSIANNFSAI